MPGKPGLKNRSMNTADIELDYGVCDNENCHEYRRDTQSFNHRDPLNYLQHIEKICQPDSSNYDYQSSTSEDRRQCRKPLRKVQACKTAKLVDYACKNTITPDFELGSCIPRGEPICQASGKEACQYPRGCRHPRNFEEPVDSFCRSFEPRDTSPNFVESSPKRCWRRCADASPTFYGRYTRRGDCDWPQVKETSSFEVIRDRYVDQNSQTSAREDSKPSAMKCKNVNRSVCVDLTTDTESTMNRFDRVRDCCDANQRMRRRRSAGNVRYDVCAGEYADRHQLCTNSGDLNSEEVCQCEEFSRELQRRICKRELDGKQRVRRPVIKPTKEKIDVSKYKNLLRQSLSRVCCDGGTIRKHPKSAGHCKRSEKLPQRNQTAVCQCCVETARRLNKLAEPLHSLRTLKTQQWLDQQNDHKGNQCVDSPDDYRPAKCVTKHNNANVVGCSCKVSHDRKRESSKNEPCERSVPQKVPESRSPIRTDKTCLPPSQDHRLSSNNTCCRAPPEVGFSDINGSPRSLKQPVRPPISKSQLCTGGEGPPNESSKDRNRPDKVAPDLRNCAVEGMERTGKVCGNEFKLDDLTPDVTIDHWRMYGRRWEKMTEEYKKLTGTLKTTQTEAEDETKSPCDRVRKRLTRSYPSGKEFCFEVRTPTRKEYATCPPGSPNMVGRDHGQNPRRSPDKPEGSCPKEGPSKDADMEFRKKHEARWHKNLFPNSEMEKLKRSKAKNLADLMCCDACSCSEVKTADNKKETCKPERISKSGYTGVSEKCGPCSPTRIEAINQIKSPKHPTKLTTQVPVSPIRNKVKIDASPVRQSLCSPRKCSSPTPNKLPVKHIEHPLQYICARNRKFKSSSPSSENRSPRCCAGNVEYEPASSESCPLNCHRSPVHSSRRRNTKSATAKCGKMVRKKSAKCSGRSNTRKIQIYSPHDDKCPPLTLYKSSSTIDCEVQGDFKRGFRYNVTYVQKFVSSRWCPTKGKSHGFMEHKCECSSDYG